MKRATLIATLALAATLAGFGAHAQTAKEKEKDKDKKERTLTFEVYKDAKGEFRWRLKATNGQAIATSGEGYKAKADCLHGIEVIKDGASKATTDDKS